ncbi:glycosyltransferase [Geodermatophilus sp. SYSU D01176]
MTPAVSVVTIFLDAERFLDEAIESVVAQTFPDWELLLVDDGSTDRSGAIARAWARRHPDRIRYLAHPGGTNRGMSASRNLGIAHARADLLAFLDADDVWLPGKLAAQVRLAADHPEVGMICGPTQYWHSWQGDPDGRTDELREIGVPGDTVVDPPRLLTGLLREQVNAPATCSVLLRQDAVASVGGFEESFRGMFEDRAFFAKIYRTVPVYVASSWHDRYRQHDDSVCARAARAGTFDPADLSPAHEAFLVWFDAYLRRTGERRADVLAAMDAALWPYRHPRRHRLRRLRYASRSWAGRWRRRITGGRPAAHSLAPRPIIGVDLDGDLDPVLPSLPAGPAPADVLLLLWSGGVPVGQLVVPATQLPLSRADARLAAARDEAAAGPGRAAAPLPGAADDVTVVICTRDRPEWLARCLAALGRSIVPPAEVVVVDNAPSSAATRELVDRMPGVRYVLEPRPGLDIARNTGLRAATTEFVAYTDDDAEPHPDWTWRTRRAFDDASITAVTGLVLPAELDTDAQVLFEDHAGFGRGFARRDFGPEFLTRHRRGAPVWEIGAGANMAFRRSAVAALGGFDERLDVGAAGCSGDSEMWYRLLASGGRCRYEPSAVVRHHHRRTHEELLRQMYFYMRGHACALLVQFERHRGRSNLVRLFLVLPRWYATTAAKALLRRLRGAPRAADALLAPQVRGCLAGVLFYLRTRRPTAMTEPNRRRGTPCPGTAGGRSWPPASCPAR